MSNPFLSDDYLAHYGRSKRDGAKVGSGRYRLGSGKNPRAEKRGERNPIDDTVLPKGTKLNTVSSQLTYLAKKHGLRQDEWTYTYSPDVEWDNKVYKGPFAYYKMMLTKEKQLESMFETTKDLKMPTEKERLDAFIELYNNNTKTVIKELAKMQKSLRANNIGDKEVQNLNLKNLSTEQDYRAAYEIFNHCMEKVHAYECTKEYKAMMESKWDAMVDDNNQGVYNGANDPIIIFKAHEVLRDIGGVRVVEPSEVYNNMADVQIELAKLGRSPKL